MRTWEDYKRHVEEIDSEVKKDFEDIETISLIISTMIRQRKHLGLTQRELAELCGLPQSSVARIEAFRITPNLNTLIRMLNPLRLKITISAIEEL